MSSGERDHDTGLTNLQRRLRVVLRLRSERQNDERRNSDRLSGLRAVEPITAGSEDTRVFYGGLAVWLYLRVLQAWPALSRCVGWYYLL